MVFERSNLRLDSNDDSSEFDKEDSEQKRLSEITDPLLESSREQYWSNNIYLLGSFEFITTISYLKSRFVIG